MVTMMTGRVLLVCALCVLWCGAGCLYARDLDSKALGDCMPLGVLGVNASHVSNRCNKYMPTPPLRSVLPISAIQAEVVTVTETSQVGDTLNSGTTSSSGPRGGSGDKGDLASVPSSGVVPDPTGAARGTSKSHTGPADSSGVPAMATSGPPALPISPAPDARGPSSSEKPQTRCGDDASECGDEQSSGKTIEENLNLEKPKTGEPQVTQHTNPKGDKKNSTESPTPAVESTEPQQGIITPVNENDSTRTDASTAVAANSTSASSQEEATESSSSGSHSSPQGEVITGTNASENAQSPIAAETERQRGNTTHDGDGDSSTAASHTTSPLLLILVFAYATAAVVVAA
ncbi:mucin-associated surface protein (MASP), putative [Trypanosoma cruzi marinkellei]|uniref:Mucin-associated surface protein (MASP), putative n=1 Tax=Trypanosoma cruzi marinkellei TaxID=85056 RepID=K2MUI7_TRYCR|nr:mucin-associated surface protein (MASP), putative [Trypanosoma cruzi marinkellei]